MKFKKSANIAEKNSLQKILKQNFVLKDVRFTT